MFFLGRSFVLLIFYYYSELFDSKRAKQKPRLLDILCNIDSLPLIFEPISAFFIVRKTSESPRKRRIKEEEDVIFFVVIPCSVRLACKRKATLIGIRSIGS